MTLTKIDRKVLRFMARAKDAGVFVVPAEIGHAMGGTVSGNAQGLGPMGGRKAKRLLEMGLIDDCSAMRGGFPAYRITALGRTITCEITNG